jgi:hypothetical protein
MCPSRWFELSRLRDVEVLTRLQPSRLRVSESESTRRLCGSSFISYARCHTNNHELITTLLRRVFTVTTWTEARR